MSLIKDESAVAYGLYVIAFFLISGTIMYVLTMEVIGLTTDNFNTMIDNGIVTERIANVYSNQLTLASFVPYIMMFGLLCWGIVRALERKRTEG